MDSKAIYFCMNYQDYKDNFKSKRIWRTDSKYEPFVYFIQEVETGIKYIGSKTQKGCLESDLGTKYFTSSKEFDWKSNPKSFRILDTIPCASNHDALILEGLLIEECNAVWSKDYYNRSNGGYMFNMSGKTWEWSEHTKSKISLSNKGKEYVPMSKESMKNKIMNHRKFLDSLTENERKELYGHQKHNHHAYGKPTKDSVKKKISDSSKGKHSKDLNGMYGKNHTFESRKKMSDNHHRYWADYKWYNNGEISKRFLPNTVPLGWVEGRIDMPTGEDCYNYGKETSDEVKNKIRESTLGPNNHFYGKNHTPEAKRKMKEAAKNRNKIKCPHCGKEGGASAMKRWHFDKCKQR